MEPPSHGGGHEFESRRVHLENSRFAGLIRHIEEAPASRLRLFTATVLQPEMKLDCIANTSPQVARQYSLARISIHRHNILWRPSYRSFTLLGPWRR
jgi:hypothetical protein